MNMKTHTLFSPKAFVMFFGFCFILYCLGLSKSISSPSAELLVYALACLMFFGLGVALAGGSKEVERRPLKRHTLGLWGLYVISMLCFFSEHFIFYKTFGNLPIFLDNFEELRFQFMVSGYVHLLAMMNYIILLLIFCCKINNNEKKESFKLFLLASLLSITADLLIGNRAAFIGYIYMLVVSIAFYRKFTLKAVVVGVVGLVFFGAAKTYRDFSQYGDFALMSAAGDWYFGDSLLSVSLYNIYMGLAYNFEILNRYIMSVDDFFYGYFTLLHPVLTVMPGREYGLLELQRDVLGVNFHGVLASTMLSTPYFDYGYGGCLIIFFVGLLAKKSYNHAKRTKSPEAIALYAYVSLNLFTGIYAYTFDRFYVLLNIAFIALYFVVVKMLSSRVKVQGAM